MKNVEIHNAKMLSKDAFWNSENVAVYDSFISGEYLGWNSKNLTLVNCTIESLQGMCYIDNLVMKNCRLLNTTLAFEYASVDADIQGKIDSVFNPSGGTIRADAIGELILEKDKVDPGKTKIWCSDIRVTSEKFWCIETRGDIMDYQFDKPINRRGTLSMKWEVGESELPMWVADMDFETAPEIHEAIRKRAEHGVFGYTIIPEEWYDSIREWWKKRHHFHLKKEWLIFCTGVVPAISTAVRKLTSVAEKIVLLTPVYNILFNSIVNNGRNVVECPLTYDGESYGVDFEKLERVIADPQTTMLIFCNPHNPVGKIWEKETMERIGALCWKHHVVVISDEIHCELTDPGKEYIPFASVSEECKRTVSPALPRPRRSTWRGSRRRPSWCLILT